MCESAVEDFFEELPSAEDVSDLAGDVSEAGLNLSTLGMLGYKGGKFRPGVTGRAGIDVLKDVTGASALEEANIDARQRFQEEKEKALAERKERKAKSAQEQLLASRKAGAARGGVKLFGPDKTRVSRYSTLGSDEQDFLGI